MTIPINWWAIIVTTIVSFVLGNIWFGPLFGEAYIKMVTGKTIAEAKAGMTPEEKKGMWKNMVLVVIGSLIMNFVLLHALVYGSAYEHVTGVAAGLQVGFWNWLGFIAPVALGGVLWEKRPWKYWFVIAGYYLV